MGQEFESLQARHFGLVGIVQLVRALDCGSRGRRFESDYPPHFLYWAVAKSVKAPDFDSGTS